jgi:hypothetical protein
MGLLSAAQQIVVKVPESSGGVSTESILVFIGGVLAALAAVAAAIISSRGASSRLQQQLVNERERFEKQLDAERERANDRIGHERYLVRREEASRSLEGITRLVAGTASKFDDLKRAFLRGKDSDPTQVGESLTSLMDQLDQIQEEISVVALRFGFTSPVVASMATVLAALIEGCQVLRDALPAEGAEWKEDVRNAASEVSSATADFVIEAGKALNDY